MRKEFMVERNGRTFCLFAGLLDLAHQSGLKSITTDLLQIPRADNGNVAIVTATVILEKDGMERRFTGIGDADPGNVAPAMKTCLIRMAETRSKARALRDAVNVGVAAFEEMDASGNMDDEIYGDPAQRLRIAKPEPAQQSAAPRSQASAVPKGTGSVRPDINATGHKCAICNAPDGKEHVKTCTHAYDSLKKKAEAQAA